MKLTEYAKSRELPLSEVREAARENGFRSDHFNSALSEDQEAILDGWFSAGKREPLNSPQAGCKESLPEYFTVDLPLSLLGTRLVRVTQGNTLASREAAAFEKYKQAGGILSSRFIPVVTPIDDPGHIDPSEFFEQEVV